MHELVEEVVERYPNHVALEFLGKSLTYKEFAQSVRQFANHLQTLGLDKGDRVAIMLPNCRQGVITHFATLMAGGVDVQTNPLYVERELEHQLAIEHIIISVIKDCLPFPKNVIHPFFQKKNTGLSFDVTFNEWLTSSIK
ncbi:AMP-binding protein [Alkalihalobacillus deserti]|uniref:AMP-binding protein n=1 Tax=Alkalihalobacillus deserti TaxID=2879466 RepID=UPI001D1541C9|nr:AMP-binding protein [Alkalihalobacillus deserti]